MDLFFSELTKTEDSSTKDGHDPVNFSGSWPSKPAEQKNDEHKNVRS